jgi:hypothetical protein
MREKIYDKSPQTLDNEAIKNKIKKYHKKNYLFNYLFDPTQYDGRTFRIIYYFHRNNEPLFYLALSYCSITAFAFYAIFRKQIVKKLFNKYANKLNRKIFIEKTMNLK